jgi:serine/threonine protein kinase/tetratricopeptide (TPR) repeat protein
VNPGDSIPPTTLINGRYRVLRKLGEGGMGAVHLVADTLDEDRLLALKTVRSELFEEQGDQRLRDEFAAMTQLRHPNVVEVYDFGSIDATGDLFFTMEHIEGRSLREACERATPRRIYRYAAQICRALAYIHAQGFIHFDLKPDNIMVASSGAVKVMDFGLVGKGSFFQARLLQGTAAYIAPEMIAGLPVDQRLDLYSLGAVLFRVVTGRHLFTGGTTVEVLWRHLDEPPNLTDDLPRPLPAPLRPILKRLLAKKPDDRYASAAEVLVEIERLLEEEAQRDPLPEGRVAMGSRFVGRRAQLDALQSAFDRRVAAEPSDRDPSLFVVTGESGMGKSRLIQELRHHAQLSGVRFFHGSCLQNGGQPYQAFAEILTSIVREILAPPTGPVPDSSIPPPPSHSIAPLLRDSEAMLPSPAAPARSLLDFAGSLGADSGAGSPGSAKLARRFDANAVTFIAPDSVAPSEPPRSSNRYARGAVSEATGQAALARIAEHAAALAMLVPEDEPLRALASASAAAPALSPARPMERTRVRMIDSICRFLVDLSRIRPIAVYVSDLHWADEPTIEMLTRLSRVAREQAGGSSPARLMIYGCLRDNEGEAAKIQKAIDGLAAEGAAAIMALSPLEPADVAEMLKAMLGRVEISDEALAIIVERTRGNPFAIEATVQEAVERRAIVRSGAVWVALAEELRGELAPATVAQALDRTLVKLTEPDAGVLRLLAVFNRPVSVALLREAGAAGGAAITDGDLSQILSRLRKEHFVQRGWAEGRYHYSLRHAQLRERVYGRIDEAERAHLHKRAGAAMDRLFPGSGRYLEDIAQHFRRAGSIERAIRSMRAAADQAKRVYDLTRAASLYSEAYDLLDALPDAPERSLDKADLAVAIEEVSYFTPSERNSERLRTALSVVEAIGDRARAIGIYDKLGRAYYALGRNPEAIRCFRQVIRLSEGNRDDQIRALPYSVLGRVYVFMGRFEEARDYLSQAAGLLRGQPGCEDELSYALGMLGGAYVYCGEFEKGQALIAESRALGESIKNATRISQAHVYSGVCYSIQGEWAVAREELKRAVDTALPIGNVIGAGTASSFLGLTYLAEGDAARAVELCRFGRDHITAAGGTWTFSMIGSHLADALLASGEVDEARRVAEETIPVVDGGEHWGEVYLFTALGRIHARRGDRGEARIAFARAIDVAERQKSPVFEAKARLAMGIFLLSIGEREAGLADVTRARAGYEALGMYWHLARALAVLGGAEDVGPCP